jgi:uncharacterized phiE125 gp8 family phage protein
MALRIVTPPAAYPITIEEARLHLKLDAEDSPAVHADDDLVNSLIAACALRLDGRDGELGRCLITQTWDLVLDRFPKLGIKIPLPPLQSVTALTYLDTAGDEQTLVEDTDFTVDAISQPGWAWPGEAGWPATFDGINTVTLRFVAGYGAASAVPAPIKAALKLMVGSLYANREDIVIGTTAMEIPGGIDRILSTYRIPVL